MYELKNVNICVALPLCYIFKKFVHIKFVYIKTIKCIIVMVIFRLI